MKKSIAKLAIVTTIVIMSSSASKGEDLQLSAKGENRIFIEAGVGGAFHNKHYYDIAQYGIQGTLGMFLDINPSGAWRVACIVGSYAGDKKNVATVNGVGTVDIDESSTVMILANFGREFYTGNASFRLGVVGGYATLTGTASGSVWDYKIIEGDFEEKSFTYGGMAGLSYGFGESFYLTGEYKIQGFLGDMKKNQVHSFVVGLGFAF